MYLRVDLTNGSSLSSDAHDECDCGVSGMTRGASFASLTFAGAGADGGGQPSSIGTIDFLSPTSVGDEGVLLSICPRDPFE